MLEIPSPAPKKSGNLPLSPNPQARPCPYADSSGLFICTLPDTAACRPSWRTGPTAWGGGRACSSPQEGDFLSTKPWGFPPPPSSPRAKLQGSTETNLRWGQSGLGKRTPPSRWAFLGHGWAPLVATMKPCRANLGHIRGIPDAHKAEAGSPGPALH